MTGTAEDTPRDQGITDTIVQLALRAYEEPPPWTGREERMRAALRKVLKAKAPS
jgi:hypothetical protein